jgi:hypothetical protein
MIKDRLKLFYSILSNIFTKNKIILVTESADGVIKDICQNISLQLNNQYPKTGFGSTYSTLFLRNKIIHFGSINTIFDGDLIRSLHPSNKAMPNSPNKWWINSQKSNTKNIKNKENTKVRATMCVKTGRNVPAK